MMDCKQFRHELALAADASDDVATESEAALASRVSPAARLHMLSCTGCQKFEAELTTAMQALHAVALECRLSDLSSSQRERFRSDDSKPPLPVAGHGIPVTLQLLAEHLPDRTEQTIPFKSWAEMKQAAGLTSGVDAMMPAVMPAAQGAGHGRPSHRKTSSAGWYPTIAVMAASVLIAASLTNPLIVPDGDASGHRVATRNLFNDPRFLNQSRDFQRSALVPVSLEQQWTTPPVMPEFPQEADVETAPKPKRRTQ
jgi:hypothetical protein